MAPPLHSRITVPKRARKTPLDPEVLDEFLRKATELHSAGRFNEAARFYQHIRDCNPETVAAPYFHALMDVEVGYLDHALERLRHVVRRDPASYEAQYALAYVFELLGQWRQAVDGYRRAVALQPGNIVARDQLAGALEVLGHLDDAVAEFRKLTHDPRTRL